MSEYAVKEPLPLPGAEEVLSLAIEAVEDRAAIAVREHGTPLMTFNDRDAFMDSAQEIIDALQYQVQGIEEMRVLTQGDGACIGDVRVELEMYLFTFKLQPTKPLEFFRSIAPEVAAVYTGTAVVWIAPLETLGLHVPAYHGSPAVIAGKIARLINERARTWQNS